MKSLYTNHTPIPSQVPRQLALDILHSHGEVITLNPLVIDHQPIKPPRDAPNDEYYSTWYEITQRIQFVPGLGKAGSGKVSFKGCFHDMPWGIQTHMYVPMGIDLKHKWEVKGTQPGEPPEPREIGSEAPTSGLYLQETVQIECNPLALSFTKKELKAASKVMVDRMMKKAELLDAGVLQAMFEDGKLRTINPNDRSHTTITVTPPMGGDQWRRPESVSHGSLSSRQSTYSQSNYAQPSQYALQGQSSGAPAGVVVEMMGDTHFPAHTNTSTNSQNNQRASSSLSNHTELPADTPEANHGRWSGVPSGGSQTSHSSVSRPTSYNTVTSDKPVIPDPLHAHPPQRSPNMASFQFGTPRAPSPGGNAPGASPPQQYTPYNPQEYANFTGRAT